MIKSPCCFYYIVRKRIFSRQNILHSFFFYKYLLLLFDPFYNAAKYCLHYIINVFTEYLT